MLRANVDTFVREGLLSTDQAGGVLERISFHTVLPQAPLRERSSFRRPWPRSPR